VTNRVYWITGLFAVEILAIILVFQVFSAIECQLTSVAAACHGLHDLTVRFLCVLGSAVTLLWFSPDVRRSLLQAASEQGANRLWLVLHMLGIALIFVPWLSWDPERFNEDFRIFLITLSFGGILAGLGGMGWLIPYRALRDVLRNGGYGLWAVIVLSFFLPDLAAALGFLWHSFDALLLTTFFSIALILSALGHHVVLDPDVFVIGTGDFFVEVASACSGIEGFALTTAFMAIYAFLMRDTLRQGRYWALVYPAALLVSWILNVVRIAMLILIGEYYSPTLAVDGFHSFAGWLFFTILAVGVLGVVQGMRGLHRGMPTERRAEVLLPFRQDPSVAQIVPFMALMLSGLMSLTFWQYPELGYPWQVLAVALVLWLFRKPFLALDLSRDPIAIGVGVVVGVGWVLTAGSQDPLTGLDLLTPAALSLWVICRMIGTCLIVPVVEEAFFRGYLLRWMSQDNKLPVLFAVVLSSLGFALLHGRIIEAGLAGVLFAWLYLRHNRLGDAILAHVIANSLIAIAALLSGNWSLI
jgi:CAAX protease family protein